MAGMTILGHRNVGALDPAPLWRHALLVPIHYGFYLFKICWPAQLGPLYPLIAFSWMRFIAAGILLAVFSFWAWRIRSSRPQIGIGWLWFCCRPLIFEEGERRVGALLRVDAKRQRG